jgi:hypothetical protein
MAETAITKHRECEEESALDVAEEVAEALANAGAPMFGQPWRSRGFCGDVSSNGGNRHYKDP